MKIAPNQLSFLDLPEPTPTRPAPTAPRLLRPNKASKAATPTNPKLQKLLERSRGLSDNIASAFVFKQNGRFNKLCRDWDAVNSEIFDLVEGVAA